MKQKKSRTIKYKKKEKETSNSGPDGKTHNPTGRPAHVL